MILLNIDRTVSFSPPAIPQVRVAFVSDSVQCACGSQESDVGEEEDVSRREFHRKDDGDQAETTESSHQPFKE